MKSNFDVVIAGGGIMGSSCACFLAATPGFDGSILVIEPDPTYRTAASTLSAGSIRQQFSTPVNIAISQFGMEFLKNAHERLACGPDAPDISLVDSTYLYLSSGDGLAALLENNRVQRKCGVSVKTWKADELGQQLPWMNVSDLHAGSMVADGEGWFDGYQLLMAMRRKVRALGVTYLRSRVENIVLDHAAQVSSVSLSGGVVINCGSLVNATGTYSRRLAASAGIDLPVHARKRCVFVFESEQAIADCPLVIDPSGLWFRPEGRQFICGMPPDPDPEVALDDFAVDHSMFEARIWPLLAHRVPAFEAIRSSGSWAGHYDYNTFDQNAIVGPHPVTRNLYFASGFSGHGLQQAPAVGRGISEHIVHGEYRALDLSRLAYERIPNQQPLIERNVI
jgi:glycine/D-amino acid oxidase-like deaminating enzyme